LGEISPFGAYFSEKYRPMIWAIFYAPFFFSGLPHWRNGQACRIGILCPHNSTKFTQESYKFWLPFPVKSSNFISSFIG
jgi:hypothetical protein